MGKGINQAGNPECARAGYMEGSAWCWRACLKVVDGGK